MLVGAVTVYAHATLSEWSCVAHPQSVGCENPAVLRPEFPHGGEPMPIDQNRRPSVIVNSTNTGTVTLTSGILL